VSEKQAQVSSLESDTNSATFDNETLARLGKLSALGDQISGIIHELKQPLNVIKIICQSGVKEIERGRYTVEDSKQDYPDIMAQLKRTEKILDHLGARARSSKRDEIIEKTDINLLVQTLLGFFTAQLKAHNINLDISVDQNLPTINCSQVNLEQSVFNLVVNARKAVQEDNKTNKKIEVKTYVKENKIVIEINDTGIGIAKEASKKVFEAFYTTWQKTGSIGLGLSIVKNNITALGGEVEFESEECVGSTFRILLPSKTKEDGKKD